MCERCAPEYRHHQHNHPVGVDANSVQQERPIDPKVASARVYVESRGYSGERAAEIVNEHGADAILASKKNQELEDALYMPPAKHDGEDHGEQHPGA